MAAEKRITTERNICHYQIDVDLPEEDFESDVSTPLLPDRRKRCLKKRSTQEIMADKITEFGYNIARKYRKFQREYKLLDASYDIELGPGK